MKRVLFAVAACALLAFAPAASARPLFRDFVLSRAQPRPQSLTLGRDKALWFSQHDGSRRATISRLSIAGKITRFKLPAGEAAVVGLTVGPDGALWYTRGTAVGRMDAGGALTVYPLASADLFARAITAGPDGALWFVIDRFQASGGDEQSRQAIGRIDTAGRMTTFPLPEHHDYGTAGFDSITAGPDGALWFTRGGAGRVGRITTSGDLREFTLPGFWSASCARKGPCGPQSITAGPDGRLWFVNDGRDRIGRLDVSGKLRVFRDRCSDFIRGITGGVDGALWYAGQGYIGRITPRGKIRRWALTGFPIQSSLPYEITAGPGHAAWFTTFRTVGRIAPRAATTKPTIVPPRCDAPGSGR